MGLKLPASAILCSAMSFLPTRPYMPLHSPSLRDLEGAGRVRTVSNVRVIHVSTWGPRAPDKEWGVLSPRQKREWGDEVCKPETQPSTSDKLGQAEDLHWHIVELSGTHWGVKRSKQGICHLDTLWRTASGDTGQSPAELCISFAMKTPHRIL